MTRSLHAMSIERRTVLERRFGPGLGVSDVETVGRIDEASYLGARSPGFWARLFGAALEPVFVPPFDAEGRDVHRLFDGSTPMLEGDDDPIGSVRLAQGTITALVPRELGDEVVLRDAWSVERGVRLTSAVHFGLLVAGRPPVAVAFSQSPLVVARPTAGRLEDALIDVSERGRVALRHTWPGLDTALPAELVTLAIGEVIEVLGVVATPEQCRGRFDLEGRATTYRDAPSELSLVVGDRQGMRMVIRRSA